MLYAIIVILIVFGLMYYRITQGRFPGSKPRTQSSTAVTKQKPQLETVKIFRTMIEDACDIIGIMKVEKL